MADLGRRGRDIRRRAILLGWVLPALVLGAALPLGAGPALEWREDLFTALGESREAGRPAVIRFDADWCSICDRLERKTLRHRAVAARLAGFERVLIDVTEMSPARRKLMERFGVSGVPALLFVSSEGQILDRPRVAGFIEPEALVEILERLAPGAGGSGGSRAVSLERGV